mmetsp:Transcript_80043/g.248726  ORF Transcript_80043/g.248726 Transcript_80043/m.248726 type:complete len:222 (-) Transcript_80043:43-708(-)
MSTLLDASATGFAARAGCSSRADRSSGLGRHAAHGRVAEDAEGAVPAARLRRPALVRRPQVLLAVLAADGPDDAAALARPDLQAEAREGQLPALGHVVEEDEDDLLAEPLGVVALGYALAVGDHVAVALGHAQGVHVCQGQARDGGEAPLDGREDAVQLLLRGLHALLRRPGQGPQRRRLLGAQEARHDRHPRLLGHGECVDLPRPQGLGALFPQQLIGVH